MALLWRLLPAWPPYTDPDGHEWKLAPNGYWWLHYGGFWHQAGSIAAGDVLGVAVPQATLRGSGDPDTRRHERLADEARADVTQKRKIRLAAAAPNIPPDFVPLPLGEGCCAGCRLDDGPLYDGRLCRYCWMLAQVPVDAPAAADVVELEPAQPARQALIASAAIVSLLLALWLGLRLALLIIGHL